MKLIGRVLGTLAALGLLGLVMAYLAGFFHEKIDSHPTKVTQQPPEGIIVKVEVVEEPLIEQATGTVQAKNEAVISARIMATIASIPVRAGDTVKTGEPLIILDSRELEARLEQQLQTVTAAQARLSEAESTYNRIKSLAERGLATKAELDRAEAALRTARAELERARRMAEEAGTALSYSTISAPFPGRVIERFADPGDTATPGTPLMRIYDPENLRLEANVRESLASELNRGRELTVHIDALDQEFSAMVDEIVPSADPGSRSFVVKVMLPAQPNLYPGMFGRLLIPSGTTKRLHIPTQAIARVGQLEFVIVLTDEGAIRRYIRTGIQTDEHTEVLSGLAPGERVILPP